MHLPIRVFWWESQCEGLALDEELFRWQLVWIWKRGSGNGRVSDVERRKEAGSRSFIV